MRITIHEAKNRLLLPAVARRLGIAGTIPETDGTAVQCWWPDRHPNGDRNPSFNLHSGLMRFKCFGCGIEGDAVDLIRISLGISAREAIPRFIQMAGGALEKHHAPPRPSSTLRLPADISPGTDAEWRAVAELRQLNPESVALASACGVLKFGTVCGSMCWVVLDGSGILAEARRMDGRPFPPILKLGERKAHTLAGSKKSWPVGIQVGGSPAVFEAFDQFAVVEGGPDLLAAYHFCIEQDAWNTLPVAMLGRECKTIHPMAMRLFREKVVRIFPHNDPDGGGVDAAKRWRKIILDAGAAKVDGFSFEGLSQTDGQDVIDLNDCTAIRADQKPELEGMFL